MEEAKHLFKKLKAYSLLDLALNVPASYDDTTLNTELTIGRICTVEATVKDANMLGGKLRVIFHLKKFDRVISATFFRTTPYHRTLFAIGSHHTIQGRVEIYNGYLQMSQPKSLKEVGKITPKYKTVLKESEIRALMQCFINEQALYHEGLDSRETAILMRVHFPNLIGDVHENGSLKPEIVSVLKFVEAYNHLKKLKGKRIDYPSIHRLTGDIESFVSALPFELTDEQSRVIAQIRSDLARSDKAAKRMVVGDVGSGKTMVILASAMMALPYKSILMAPTSLLALQLYEEACRHLPKDVKTALVMQGKETPEYTQADFIIGTHALLYKQDLPSAALVMVDEQHRFGTVQRQSLEAMISKGGDKRAHYIQFSATPIPRTQAMMESELIDVSLITKTPFEKDVTTRTIRREDFGALMGHIKEEIEQNHQVLIIYPLVEQSEGVPYQSLEESRGFWESKFNNVYVTHGKDKEKEEVLLAFREKGDILLATTVVEVGISLPRLTLIVIVGAERLGLATLHQLRGRVGRNGLKSWCYLYSNAKAGERLTQFAQTTNGFDIAKLDLKFRNSGDILDGTIQSGQKFRWLDMGEDEEVIGYAKKDWKIKKL